VKFPLSRLMKRVKREEKSRDSEDSERKQKTPVVVREPVARDAFASERWRGSPRLVFVGSSKGGAGKSFIASNLTYILAAHSEKPVYAVDLDLDNATLSMVVPPPDVLRRLQQTLTARGIDYVNTADVLIEGVISKRALLSIPVSMFTCGGSQIHAKVRLIPAYHELKRKSQLLRLRDMDVLQMREGLRTLIDYIRSKGGVAVLDGKQKSNLGINYDPLYRMAKDEADAMIIVTEPPYLSFSTIVSQYRDALEKTVIVVNKAEPAYALKIKILLQDAARYGVPVFLVPYSSEDGEVYTRRLEPPASKLDRRTAVYTGVVARYLNLVDRCDTGCCALYDAKLSQYLRIARGGGGG